VRATPLYTLQLFNESNGYDESFSGPYGYNDNIFQDCLLRKYGLRKATYNWNFGKGIWATYAGSGGTSGFSRDTSVNWDHWQANKRQHIYCNVGPIARVPYHTVGAHLWE
jgi:hypothetical protein